jgi:hypothetical protein
MEFRPGQNIKRERGKTYVRDTVQTQVDPPKPTAPEQPKKEIKPKKDEAIQLEPVVQEPVPTGSKPKRKQSKPSSKSNRSSDSGS